MRDFKKYCITRYNLPHDSLAEYMKTHIADNERVISIIAEYNSYGSIYAYEVYTEIHANDNSV